MAHPERDESGARGPSAPAKRTWVLAPALVWTAGLVLVGLVGLGDLITGPFMSFSVFYLVPVGFMAWFGGRAAGYAGSLASALSWFLAQAGDRIMFAHAAVPYWNALVELIFFLCLTAIACALKDALARESDLARTDDLTGVANRRQFFELAEMEIRRAGRYGHPFSVAYIDLDKFKEVNDVRGHHEGDRLLRDVGQCIQASIRATDLLARMGGDEFAILMPEAGPEAAAKVYEKVRAGLGEKVTSAFPEISVSVGLVTWLAPPASTDDLLRQADHLMYAVKDEGRNGVRHRVVGAPS